eukprot:TRINITY_DN3096_c0_g1_i2.p1 TRINITY_DN3096_c0_g1~~TRINITY_DN3096_c0_g1_i2.p1  ORF type:complete len:287 (-),score=100.11 TRINITY_DN3096_c0_g1_i2:41-901(-)
MIAPDSRQKVTIPIPGKQASKKSKKKTKGTTSKVKKPVTAKVAKIKKKQNATRIGKKAIEQKERHYIDLAFRDENGDLQYACVVVNNGWTVGTVIDKLCDHVGIENNNNDAKATRMNLLMVNGGMALPTQATLTEFVSDGALTGFDALMLEFTDELDEETQALATNVIGEGTFALIGVYSKDFQPSSNSTTTSNSSSSTIEQTIDERLTELKITMLDGSTVFHVTSYRTTLSDLYTFVLSQDSLSDEQLISLVMPPKTDLGFDKLDWTMEDLELVPSARVIVKKAS